MIQAVNEVYYEHITHKWADVLSLPLEPVVKGLFVGLGRPELRHEALRIISSRSYLSPPECHYLNPTGSGQVLPFVQGVALEDFRSLDKGVK